MGGHQATRLLEMLRTYLNSRLDFGFDVVDPGGMNVYQTQTQNINSHPSAYWGVMNGNRFPRLASGAQGLPGRFADTVQLSQSVKPLSRGT